MSKKLKLSLIFSIVGCIVIGTTVIAVNLENPKNRTTVTDKSLSEKLSYTAAKDSSDNGEPEILVELASSKAQAKAQEDAERQARVEAEAKAAAEAQAKAAAEAQAQAVAKAKAAAEAQARAEAIAKAQAEEKAKLEAQISSLAAQGDTFIQQLVANPDPNIGPIGLSILKYMESSANRSSVLNKAYYLHYGDVKNTCVYFASEELRRAGVIIPNTVANTGQLIDQLSAMGWKKYPDYKELLPGDICFSTDDSTGDPSHTYTFLGFVNSGSYDYAWILDNQAPDYGGVFHQRNVAIRAVYNNKSKDAFQFFMRK